MIIIRICEQGRIQGRGITFAPPLTDSVGGKATPPIVNLRQLKCLLLFAKITLLNYFIVCQVI